MGCGFYGLLVGVEGGFEEGDRGDAAGDVHYFARFVGCEWPAYELVLAIAEPFLNYLMMAMALVSGFILSSHAS